VSYAVPDGFERELLPEDKAPTVRISMAISYCMTMAPERLAHVRAQIEELVVMRNELVHLFIERFDLWSDPGCEAALRHLEHWQQGLDELRCAKHRAAGRKGAQRHEASHTTFS